MILRYIELCRKRSILLFSIFASLFLISSVRFPHSKISAYSRKTPRVFLIRSEYPGAHPEKVEKKITEPLEESLYGGHGIQELESYSETGRSEIRIFLHDNADIRKSELEIRERIENAYRKFPTDARFPSLENFRRENSPDLILKVEKSGGDDEERQFAETVLKPEIQKEKTVSGISIYGGTKREFLISISAEKMKKYSIPAEIILRAVRKSRVKSRITSLHYNDIIYILSIKSAADSEEMISEIPVFRSEKGTVFLKDLAEVHYTKTRPTSIFRRNGKEEIAVYIHFSDQSGSDQIKKILSQEKFKGKIKILYDRREAERKEWFSVFASVSLLSTAFLYLHLRKKRRVMIGILSGLLIYFIFISFSEKFTIPQFYSVFSGICIASLRIRWNKTSLFILILSAAGCILSGFLGNFSFEILQTSFCLNLIAVGLMHILLSVYLNILYTGILKIPPVCRLKDRISEMAAARQSIYNLIKIGNFIISYSIFSTALMLDSVWKFFLKNRSLIPHPVYIISSIPVLAAVLYSDYCYLQKKISFSFPEKTSAVTANLELPSGFSLSASEKSAAVLEQRLLKLPGIETFSLSENDHSSVTVRSDKSVSSKYDWIHELKNTAGKTEPAYLYFQTEDGEPPQEELTFDVYGNDFIKMHSFISHSVQYSGTLNGTVESVYRYKPAREELLFHLDREKLAALNISEETPGETLRLYMEGSVIGKVFLKGKNRDLRIELEKKEREEYPDFLKLPIFGRDNRFTESGMILSPEQSSVPVRIQHRNKSRVLSFSVRLNEEGEKNKEEIAAKILARKTPKDIRIEIREKKENDLIIKLKKMNTGRLFIFLFFGTVFSLYLHQGKVYIPEIFFSSADNNASTVSLIISEIFISLISYGILPLMYLILEIFLGQGAGLEFIHIFSGAVIIIKFRRNT